MRDDEQHWFNIVSEQLLYLHARAAVTLLPVSARSICSRSSTALPLCWVLRQELVSAYILPGCEIPGWICLQLNDHVEGWAATSVEQAGAVGIALRQIARAIAATVGDPKVYALGMGERMPHLHMLLGSPAPDVPVSARGAEFLERVLRRDPALIDLAAACAVAARLRTAPAAG